MIEVEPYWNVNLIIWQRHPIYDGIEVEPYWNVNCISAKDFESLPN